MKFWVRDKVAVYMGVERIVGHIVRVQERVIHVQPVDKANELQVSPKQCRRLIKKKRREIWVSKSDLSCLSGKFYLTSPGVYEQNDFIKFREVKE